MVVGAGLIGNAHHGDLADEFIAVRGGLQRRLIRHQLERAVKTIPIHQAPARVTRLKLRWGRQHLQHVAGCDRLLPQAVGRRQTELRGQIIRQPQPHPLAADQKDVARFEIRHVRVERNDRTRERLSIKRNQWLSLNQRQRRAPIECIEQFRPIDMQVV